MSACAFVHFKSIFSSTRIFAISGVHTYIWKGMVKIYVYVTYYVHKKNDLLNCILNLNSRQVIHYNQNLYIINQQEREKSQQAWRKLLPDVLVEELVISPSAPVLVLRSPSRKIKKEKHRKQSRSKRLRQCRVLMLMMYKLFTCGWK